MPKENSLTEDLTQINASLTSVLEKTKTLSGTTDKLFIHWEKACRILGDRLLQNTMRIAVTGVMKSGKSTFLNSYFEGDYLEHGAGAVTSIITKISEGEGQKAFLTFKSLHEINQEVAQCVDYFSIPEPKAGKTVDLNVLNDRRMLNDFLESLTPTQKSTNGIQNPQTALIQLYLTGYQKVEKVLNSRKRHIIYEGEDFENYRTYVRDESRAVYLKDIRLEISKPHLKSQLEFADCQGSDSLNPNHLLMIQEYLLGSHFIIYVISSRTGLRRADMKFISMLGTMGILQNVFFVVNSDLDAHGTVGDLNSLVDKTRQDLALVTSSPQLYTFSCLLNFFYSRSGFLCEKDVSRFKQWTSEADLTEFSKQEFHRFKTDFRDRVIKKRNKLMLLDNLGRHINIINGLNEWLNILKSAMYGKEAHISEQLIDYQARVERIDQIRSLAASVLDGKTPVLKKQLDKQVDRFFNVRGNGPFTKMIQFIDDYQLKNETIEKSLNAPGMWNVMDLAHLDFKQDLDLNLVRVVNPEIVLFVRTIEEEIISHFCSIAESIQTLFETNIVSSPGDPLVNHVQIEKPGMDAFTGNPLLSVPRLFSVARYSAKVKTETFFYSTILAGLAWIRKYVNQKPPNTRRDMLRVLGTGVRRMKRETKRSVEDYLEKYKEYLKEKYIFKLVDHKAGDMLSRITEQSSGYHTALNSVIEEMTKDRFNKKEKRRIFSELEGMIKSMNGKILKLREKHLR